MKFKSLAKTNLVKLVTHIEVDKGIKERKRGRRTSARVWKGNRGVNYYNQICESTGQETYDNMGIRRESDVKKDDKTSDFAVVQKFKS